MLIKAFVMKICLPACLQFTLKFSRCRFLIRELISHVNQLTFIHPQTNILAMRLALKTEINRQKYGPNSTWLVSTRLDTFDFVERVERRSTCRAHAFWLYRACRTARLDSLDTRATGTTRNLVCCVISMKL